MLIDNLFTNVIANAPSFIGILYANVSDRFLIFHINQSTKVKSCLGIYKNVFILQTIYKKLLMRVTPMTGAMF